MVEDLARAAGCRPIYIATAPAPVPEEAGGDAEMLARIALHRARRGPEWLSHEEPLALGALLEATDGQGPRMVDCLTLWLSNLMYHGHDWQAATEALVPVLVAQASPLVLVTNEVGLGIVPETALGRAFRDAQGRLNQMVAAVADEVELVVCGLPLKVKQGRT